MLYSLSVKVTYGVKPCFPWMVLIERFWIYIVAWPEGFFPWSRLTTEGESSDIWCQKAHEIDTVSLDWPSDYRPTGTTHTTQKTNSAVLAGRRSWGLLASLAVGLMNSTGISWTRDKASALTSLTQIVQIEICWSFLEFKFGDPGSQLQLYTTLLVQVIHTWSVRCKKS